jgi:TatD DNase family protein
MLVDSHSHLKLMDYKTLESDMDSILQAACENGIEHILNVCTRLIDFSTLLKIAEKYKNISLSLGLHPNEPVDREPTVSEMLALISPKIVAIGETGLDYFRSEGNLNWQQQRFRTHIEVAKQSRKPLIVHTRQAKKDTLKILKEEGARDIGGVMHCFTEDWETAKCALDINFYISFSGIVTFKNATDLQEIAKKLPLDRMLIETDSPYLAPMPHRGKMNQPAYVKHVAEFLAELRGISFETLAEKTTQNFYTLFNPNLETKNTPFS